MNSSCSFILIIIVFFSLDNFQCTLRNRSQHHDEHIKMYHNFEHHNRSQHHDEQSISASKCTITLNITIQFKLY
ncbi:unnamed protein product [Rotaria magnacalcarata]|uniref:Secreted protein n=1 Tax=Rotaria magnacalcarata TaxID=392030 RepID=A0A819R930_9BILA|nr:unnamed protein product [Rotaria magnacalcarata]CAF4129447.1 unnamed protein product [Rotaria magnacalcarata]